MMFEAKPLLEKEEAHQCARLLNISKKRILRWFENERYQGKQVESLPKGE